jgi:ABC-type transport system involved in cytochrome bd biosynthesis fused ATPase/permease subunit
MELFDGAGPAGQGQSSGATAPGYGTGPKLELAELDIAAGSFVIVSGPSGAGKTTLLSVLAGDLPAMTGEVRVGGVDPYALSYAERSRYLTLVEADSGVLCGTIEDNLRLARVGATGAELDHALRVVVLSGFVERSTESDPEAVFCPEGSAAGWPWPGPTSAVRG